MDKIKPPCFKVRINANNQVTIDSEIRKEYDIGFDDEIILKYEGKISKRVIKPKEDRQDKDGGN